MEQPLRDITLRERGKRFAVSGIIEKIVQTGGPTLFMIRDHTGALTIKAFDGAGVRAYPQLTEGMGIRGMVKINEYEGELEGEAIKLSPMSADESKQFKERVDQEQRKEARPKHVEFLAKSPILDKLKDRFIQAATEIRLAIIKGRPIIVRHHNDCDGYSAGYALERAILPLIRKHHQEVKAPWEHYNRAPCAAPFYEIEDSIKDISRALSNVAKFSEVMPLIVIVDNGSSAEDLLAIKQGKVHGAEFIVVDHHFFDKDVISNEVLVHINPFLVGEDGAHFSAGMLCSELSRFINEETNVGHIPALAGLADRIKNPSVIENYLNLAEKHGYDESMLKDIGALIDYVSAKVRFMEAREYIEVVFGEPIAKQKALLAIMAPYLKQQEATSLKIAQRAATREVHGKVTLQIIYVEQSFSRGVYPKPGKAVGNLHDYASTHDKVDRLVTAGVLSDAITMRATEHSGFSVHGLIDHIKKEVPDAFVEGGGHHHAGAIKFVPSKQADVLAAIRDFIGKIQ